MRIVSRSDVEVHRRAGHDLIPLHAWDHVDGRGERRGKTPRDPDWTHRSYTTADLRAAIDSGCNLGVRLGPTDMVIDYDPRHDPGGEGLAGLERIVGPDLWLACPRVITGGGGLHLYFSKPTDVRVRGKLPGYPGVEIKTAGQQVVAAGSRHPDTGAFYEWDPLCDHPTSTPAAPAILLSLAARPTSTAARAAGDLSPEKLARVLSGLDPQSFRDHDAWLEIGMASHHATAGLGVEEFVEWSTSDPAYADHGDQIRSRWSTWAREPGESAVTVDTLLMRARQAGADLSWMALELLSEAPIERPEGPAARDEPPKMVLDPIEALNEHFGVVLEGSDAFVYEISSGTPRRIRVGAFHNLLANQFIEDDRGKQVSLSRAWMASPRRRTYAGVEFAPEGGREGWLNTWTGWAIEPRPDARWSRFRELVFEVLCGGCDEYYEYVMNWCAQMVQHPSEPAEVALAFRGPKGTGKSTFGRVLKAIAGRHGFALSHGVADKFNAHLRDVVLLLADEAFFAGDKKSESQLKSMITEPEIAYEPKGVDAAMARNCLHIIMSSNEDWLAPASLDERRFAIFEVTAMRPRRWWDALYKEIEEGAAAGLLAHLNERVILEHPRACVPNTGALIAQKLASLPPIDMAWLQILRTGDVPIMLPTGANEKPNGWRDGPVEVGRRELQAVFKREVGGGPGGQRRIATNLGRRLRILIPQVDSVRTGRGKERSRTYWLPPLEACRVHFENLVGGEINWDE